MPIQAARRRRLFVFPALFLSLGLGTGCAGEVMLQDQDGQQEQEEQGGPPVGENGCPAHLADVHSTPCDEIVICTYYTPQCATDWSCREDGKWWSVLTCLWPSDGNWCRDPVTVGDACSYIELSCPRVGPNPPCDQPIPTAVCGPDYVWEAAPDQPPTCSD